jgi:hypothetical protein
MTCATAGKINSKEAAVGMMSGKSTVHWRARALPEIRFEEQQFTSFAGVVVLPPWGEPGPRQSES